MYRGILKENGLFIAGQYGDERVIPVTFLMSSGIDANACYPHYQYWLAYRPSQSCYALVMIFVADELADDLIECLSEELLNPQWLNS